MGNVIAQRMINTTICIGRCGRERRQDSERLLLFSGQTPKRVPTADPKPQVRPGWLSGSPAPPLTQHSFFTLLKTRIHRSFQFEFPSFSFLPVLAVSIVCNVCVPAAAYNGICQFSTVSSPRSADCLDICFPLFRSQLYDQEFTFLRHQLDRVEHPSSIHD